ncbi:MAG: M20/M25/M40 family metallo-hydrolase [Chloroflexi bacterium]|nr:M20/M25/M40 family metallo-hydrolase [Chloroflexota bacterium]
MNARTLVTILIALLVVFGAAAAALFLVPAEPALAPVVTPTGRSGQSSGVPSPVPSATSTSATASVATPSAALLAIGPSPTQAGAELSGDEIMRHLRRLSVDVGPRVSGSAGDRAAAEYLTSQFRSLGYEVEIQRFLVPYFEARRVEVKLLAPEARDLRTTALIGSGSGDVTAAIFDAGFGRDVEVTAAARGKIALVERGEIAFAQKARNAASAGALAVLIFNNEDTPFTGTLGDPVGLPVVGIAATDGEALRRAAGSGRLRVRVVADTVSEQREGQNVVARLPGEVARVILGAHYDTVPGSPGANDNASGTATVVELARLFAARGQRQRLIFVAFGGEEIGLEGSRHFVGQLPAERLRDLRAMFSVDQIAVGERLMVGSTADTRSQSLRESTIAQIGRHGVRAFAGHNVSNSDHAPFSRAGVPAVFVNRPDDPHQHTPADAADRLQPEPLLVIARALVDLAVELSSP